MRFALKGAAVLLTAVGLVTPALAQTPPTFRISPASPVFSTSLGTSIDLFVDDVPPAGLRGFNVFLSFGDNITFQSATLDPNLISIWGQPIQNLPNEVTTTLLQWTVQGSNVLGPTGTVKLGRVAFLGNFNGSGTFMWGLNSSISTTSAGSNDISVVGPDVPYTVGAPNSDMTITCSQSSPADPNFFVDGDVITLNCVASNAGPGTTGRITSALAVFSADAVIDPGDSIIGDAPVNSLQALQTQNIIVTASPIFTIPGPRNICVGIDIDTMFAGHINETNEANNTVCSPVTVLFPERDLTVPNPPTVVGLPTDPNAPNSIHAGAGLDVTYTVTNAGTGVATDHRVSVWLSTDATLDAGDLEICRREEIFAPGNVPRGLTGGQSETRTLGPASVPLLEQCKIAFTQAQGPYFVIIQADSNNQIQEADQGGGSLEGNNTNSVAVTILPPLPPTLIAADPKAINDTQQELSGPGKSHAVFSVFSVADFASYSFTLQWSPANLIEIADPADVSVSFAPLEENGRVGSCMPSVIDNTAGTVTVSCTSSGALPGGSIEAAAGLLDVNFNAVAPGSGTFSFSGVSGTSSTGAMLNFTITPGTFVVAGPPDLQYSNVTVPAEVFPGQEFTTNFDLCNQGYGPSPAGERSSIQISADSTVSFSDAVICSILESTPLAARDCANRNVNNCTIVTDLRPGNYTLGVTLDIDPNNPTSQATEDLALPSRLFALRQAGSSRRSIESTRLPAGLGGSVGAPLVEDGNFKPKSITSVRTVVRNFNLLAGYIKPKQGRKLGLYRTPKFASVDVDSQSTNILRLPAHTIAVIGGADIDGDGEDEMILVKKTKTGEFLDLRRVNYAKRRPELGVSIAVTPVLQGTIVGATGIQFDGDPEDEVAIVTDDGTTQSLVIYDLGIVAPPSESTLTPVADDLNFGSAGSAVQSLCVTDFGLDGTPVLPNEQIIALTVDASGVQAVKVFDPPSGPGGQAILVADDPAYGNTNGLKKVIGIACTR